MVGNGPQREGENSFSFDPFDKETIFNLMRDVAGRKYDLLNMGKASLNIIRDYTPNRAAKTIVETIKFVLNNRK